MTCWATGQHLRVDRVVAEVGSALNGKRRTFLALLKDPTVTTIVGQHRDRFARFGAEYVPASLEAARLYGRRAAVRAARMVECVTVAHCPDGVR